VKQVEIRKSKKKTYAHQTKKEKELDLIHEKILAAQKPGDPGSESGRKTRAIGTAGEWKK